MKFKVKNDNEINKGISEKLGKVAAFANILIIRFSFCFILFVNHTNFVIEYFHQRNIENEKRKKILSWVGLFDHLDRD
jgi:hypothetical protein